MQSIDGLFHQRGKNSTGNGGCVDPVIANHRHSSDVINRFEEHRKGVAERLADVTGTTPVNDERPSGPLRVRPG